MGNHLHNSSDTLQRRNASRRIWRLYFITVSFGILVIPLFISFFEFPYIKALLATTSLAVCLYPTARYFARQESGVPVISVLCLAYALQFAVPIFTNDPEIRLAYGDVKYLDDTHVVTALLLSIVGICALQFGYYALHSGKLARSVPVIDLHLNEKKAVIYCIFIGGLLPLLWGLRTILSEQQYLQFSAIFTLLQNQQLVTIGILGWLVYSGRGTKWHRLLLYCIAGIAVWKGISSAFLEQAVIPVAILFVTRWLYGRRISVPGILFILAVILFLSPVKASFRQELLSNTTDVNVDSNFISDRAFLWVEQASQYWEETFNGERRLADATSDATSRADLIHQFAHIYSLTPDTIPFQYGSTYSYFLVSLIPRAIWPDKPQAGGANNFFAVTYGITTEEGVKTSTFGISLLGEGYINFGIAGVILIMALQGIVLSALQSIFGGAKSGAGGHAVFLAFFIFFLNGVGTSAEIFFGNILQNLLCSCLLLWWAREKPSIRHMIRARLESLIPYRLAE
jgi:hypothetical protein